MRFRNIYLGIGSLLMIAIWILTDPRTGLIQSIAPVASTLATLVILFKSIIYVGALHLSRKSLIDYVDLKAFFDKAFLTPEGSGRAIQGIGLMMIAISVVIFTAVNA